MSSHSDHSTEASTAMTFSRFSALPVELRSLVLGSCGQGTLFSMSRTSKQYNDEAKDALRLSLQDVYLTCLDERGVSTDFAASKTNDSKDPKSNGVRAMKTLSVAVNPGRWTEDTCAEVGQRLSTHFEKHRLDVAYILLDAHPSTHFGFRREVTHPVCLLTHLEADIMAISENDDLGIWYGASEDHLPPYTPRCKQMVEIKSRSSISCGIKDYVAAEKGIPQLTVVVDGSGGEGENGWTFELRPTLDDIGKALAEIILKRSDQAMTVALMPPHTEHDCRKIFDEIVHQRNIWPFAGPKADAALSRFTVCLVDVEDKTDLGALLRLDRHNKEVLSAHKRSQSRASLIR